jgi:hypothetical protein
MANFLRVVIALCGDTFCMKVLLIRNVALITRERGLSFRVGAIFFLNLGLQEEGTSFLAFFKCWRRVGGVPCEDAAILVNMCDGSVDVLEVGQKHGVVPVSKFQPAVDIQFDGGIGEDAARHLRRNLFAEMEIKGRVGLIILCKR